MHWLGAQPPLTGAAVHACTAPPCTSTAEEVGWAWGWGWSGVGGWVGWGGWVGMPSVSALTPPSPNPKPSPPAAVQSRPGGGGGGHRGWREGGGGGLSIFRVSFGPEYTAPIIFHVVGCESLTMPSVSDFQTRMLQPFLPGAEEVRHRHVSWCRRPRRKRDDVTVAVNCICYLLNLLDGSISFQPPNLERARSSRFN